MFFSEQDFYLALRVVLPDDAARRLARGVTGPLGPDERALLEQRSDESLSVDGLVISDDMLALMSVISEELRVKVEEFRAPNPSTRDPAEEAKWKELRRRAKAALEAKSPRPPD